MATVPPMQIAACGDAVEVFSASDGLHFRARTSSFNLRTVEGWPVGALEQGKWLRAALQVSFLCETAACESPSPDHVFLPEATFDPLLADGFNLPLIWADWNPFSLLVHAEIRGGRLEIVTSWRLGATPVVVERRGRFLSRTSFREFFLLDHPVSVLLDFIDRVNQRVLSPARRAEALAFLARAIRDVGATGGGVLAARRASAPSRPSPIMEYDDSDMEPTFSHEPRDEGYNYHAFSRLAPDQLEAAVAAYYQSRGYDTVLQPSGSSFGATVAARLEDEVELVHVLTGPVPPPERLVERLLAAEIAWRAWLPGMSLSSAVYSRQPVPKSLISELAVRRITVADDRLLADRLRSRGIAPDQMNDWQDQRCTTFREGLRRLHAAGAPIQ